MKKKISNGIILVYFFCLSSIFCGCAGIFTTVTPVDYTPNTGNVSHKSIDEIKSELMSMTKTCNFANNYMDCEGMHVFRSGQAECYLVKRFYFENNDFDLIKFELMLGSRVGWLVSGSKFEIIEAKWPDGTDRYDGKLLKDFLKEYPVKNTIGGGFETKKEAERFLDLLYAYIEKVRHSGGTSVQSGDTNSVESRLNELKNMYDEGLISEKEYSEKRMELLNQM